MFKLFFKKKEQKIGLALGGGSVRGLAHLGVLKVIEEVGLKVAYLSGTSIGAIIGAFYASGMEFNKIVALAKKIKWYDVYLFAPRRSGLSSSYVLEKLIKHNIKHDSFSKLKIPFQVVVSNISSGKKVVKSNGSLSEAVRMSASFPGVYTPVEKDGDLFVDGAVFSNLPTEEIRSMGADIAIGVDVIPNCKISNSKINAIEIMDRSLDLILKDQTKRKRANLILEPNKEYISAFDLSKKDLLINFGEIEARKKLIPFLQKKKLI